MTRKLVALLLVLALCIPVCSLAECAYPLVGDQVDSSSLYPIVTDGSITFDYLMPINGTAFKYIETYAENPSYQLIAAKTGINVNFIHPAQGQFNSFLSTTVMSGDLPDLIQYAERYSGGIQQGIEDGVYIDLTPYLEEYAPDYWAMLQSNSTLKIQGTTADGKVGAFYMVNMPDDSYPYTRMLYRSDWAKEFGMDTPVTLADWEAYFQAVVDNKPGVTPFYINMNSADQISVLLGCFDFLGGYYLRDGQVGHWYTDANLKAALEVLNRWYEKGFISSDFTSMKDNDVYAMFDSGRLACYIHSTDTVFQRTKDIENFEFDSSPYPRLTADQQLHNEIATDPVSSSLQIATAVSSQCEHPEAAVTYLNYLYTLEGANIANYGYTAEDIATYGIDAEAPTYEMVDGVPTFTDYILHNPNGLSCSACSYMLKIHFAPKVKESDMLCNPGVISVPEQRALRLKYSGDPTVDNSLRLPVYNLTAEDQTTVNELMEEISPFAKEYILKFITGAVSLDEFDNYVNKLNSLGMVQILAIKQAGYEAAYGNAQ